MAKQRIALVDDSFFAEIISQPVHFHQVNNLVYLARVIYQRSEFRPVIYIMILTEALSKDRLNQLNISQDIADLLRQPFEQLVWVKKKGKKNELVFSEKLRKIGITEYGFDPIPDVVDIHFWETKKEKMVVLVPNERDVAKKILTVVDLKMTELAVPFEIEIFSQARFLRKNRVICLINRESRPVLISKLTLALCTRDGVLTMPNIIQ